MPEPHRYECLVRWSDVDAYGHVNNVTYFEYFQEARIQALGRSLAHREAGAFVVARVQVDYRRPVLFRAEPYVIETCATRIGTSSFDLTASILDGADCLATSRTVLVGFDGQTERSRPLNESERVALKAILIPEAAPGTC